MEIPVSNVIINSLNVQMLPQELSVKEMIELPQFLIVFVNLVFMMTILMPIVMLVIKVANLVLLQLFVKAVMKVITWI